MAAFSDMAHVRLVMIFLDVPYEDSTMKVFHMGKRVEKGDVTGRF